MFKQAVQKMKVICRRNESASEEELATDIRKSRKRKSRKKIRKLKATTIRGGKNNKGGKLMYFGIEGAIKEDSPGLLSKNAHLLFSFFNVMGL